MTDDEMTKAEQAGRRQARGQYARGVEMENPFDRMSIQCIGFDMELNVIRMEEDMSSTFGGEP
jgi:hypothetical protein